MALKHPDDEKRGICWWCKQECRRNYVTDCNGFQPAGAEAEFIQQRMDRGERLSRLEPPEPPPKS